MTSRTPDDTMLDVNDSQIVHCVDARTAGSCHSSSSPAWMGSSDRRQESCAARGAGYCSLGEGAGESGGGRAPPHHLVDLLDRQGEVGPLKADGLEVLKDLVVIDPVVEVVAARRAARGGVPWEGRTEGARRGAAPRTPPLDAARRRQRTPSRRECPQACPRCQSSHVPRPSCRGSPTPRQAPQWCPSPWRTSQRAVRSGAGAQQRAPRPER